MSKKSENTGSKSSNGFKKRLLRPVSTNKQGATNNLMKNSCLLNLKDSLSLKNKYGQILGYIKAYENEVEDQFQSLRLKNQKDSPTQLINSTISVQLTGKQFIKQQILRFNSKISNKQLQGNLLKQNSKKSLSIYDEKFSFSKSSDQILSQIKISNFEDGLKYLYNKNQQVSHIIEKCSSFLGISALKMLQRSKTIKQNQDLKTISGNQQSIELLAKLIIFILRQIKENQMPVLNLIQQNEQTPKPKFKNLFTARDQAQTTSEIKKLSQQINELNNLLDTQKAKNSQLQTLIKKTISNSQTEQQIKISQKIEKVHDQIKQIYDEVLKKKDEEIFKVKSQVSYLQQNLTKLSTFNQFSSESQKRAKSKQMMGLNITQNHEFSNIVQEQFEKMRQGFVKKIQKLQKQWIQKQQIIKKQLFQLQKQFKTVQWERKIILKKYQYLVSQDV